MSAWIVRATLARRAGVTLDVVDLAIDRHELRPILIGGVEALDEELADRWIAGRRGEVPPEIAAPVNRDVDATYAAALGSVALQLGLRPDEVLEHAVRIGRRRR